MAINVSVTATVSNNICTIIVDDTDLQGYWRIVRCYAAGGIPSTEKQYEAGQSGQPLTLNGITNGTIINVEILDYYYTIIGQGSAVATSTVPPPSYVEIPWLELQANATNITSTSFSITIQVVVWVAVLQNGVVINQYPITNNTAGTINISSNPSVVSKTLNTYFPYNNSILITNANPNTEYKITLQASTYYLTQLSNDFILSVKTQEKVKPSNFNWTYTKASGQSFNLTALEWQLLQNKVDEWYIYFNQPKPSWINIAITGQPFTYKHYNEMVDKILVLNPLFAYNYSLSNTHKQYENIKAEYLNNLVEAINHL